MINGLLIFVLLALTACSLPVPLPTAISGPAAALPAATPTASKGYITFVINVHDWVNAGASADTLIRLVDLFEKNRVSADFYMTAPVVEKYAAEHPDVIARLVASSMTISYHVRPPHPLYTGFDSRLKGLDDAALYQTLMDYETYALDLTTGNLDRSRSGGYAYVAQIFGVKPVTAAAPNQDRRIKETAQRVYTALGARMTILYHEEGTDLAHPLVYSGGMLVRPSDFSITRVPGSENFWWNFMSSPRAAELDPTHLLQVKLAEWDAERQPFITVLIHENNFYRSGPESWTPIYFAGSDKSHPLTPPFSLSVRDTSKPRTTVDQKAIWNAYERLVAYAAENLQVITSTDLVKLAATGG